MPLAADFMVFISPQSLRGDERWNGLALQRNAAYQRRYFVHGFREAAQALGFRSARALWQTLAVPVADRAPSSGLLFAGDKAITRTILAAVPAQWKIDLPDINDRGDAKHHTTYWREFSPNQLVNTWETKEQTLPKALLSIVALYLAAGRKGLDWDALIAKFPVIIKASVFWLLDYSEEVYDAEIGRDLATTRNAYAACGLEYDLGPGRRSEALRDAAKGHATMTYETAERVRLWLAKRKVLTGPVRVAPEAYKLGATGEVFLRS